MLSSLPMSFVQPFLRGGGRAVTLEPLTQAERNLVYQVRSFAQFRQQFFVVTLTGGTIQNFGTRFPLAGFSAAGNTDPTIGFIPAAFNVVQVENDRRNVAFFENLVKLYRELIQGESSGLSQFQLDQVMSSLIRARQALVTDKMTYRNELDQFKMQMGLPPDIPFVARSEFLATPFYEVFDDIDEWQRRPDRNLTTCPRSSPSSRSSRTSTSMAGRSWGSTGTIGRPGGQTSCPRTRTAWKTCCRRPSGSRWSTGST